MICLQATFRKLNKELADQGYVTGQNIESILGKEIYGYSVIARKGGEKAWQHTKTEERELYVSFYYED